MLHSSSRLVEANRKLATEEPGLSISKHAHDARRNCMRGSRPAPPAGQSPAPSIKKGCGRGSVDPHPVNSFGAAKDATAFCATASRCCGLLEGWLGGRKWLAVAVVLFLLPKACFAEVMDKELSLPAIWTEAGVLAIAGYLLGRYRIWAGIPAFALAALLAWAQISELTDPYVGPDIAQQAGHSYFVQSYVACTFALIAPIVGIFETRFRRRMGRI
ncbi:MAG: hypothetical protein JWM69_1489 [Candidatus Binatus sp.]|nr:hypothetical protein [Candidatus Binatus sp.]